jgi:hypothetical protein
MFQKIINGIKRISLIISNYVHLLYFWHEPITKFIILGQGRTGSTLLVELLNQHPDIHCEEEILNKNFFILGKKIPFPFLYIKGISRKKNRKVFGFKFKLEHIINDQNIEPSMFINKLYSNGYKIIYLYRHDVVQQEISSLLAWHNKKYHIYEHEKFEFKPITINKNYFIKRLKQRIAYRKVEYRLLENLKHKSIVYEYSLLNNFEHQKTIDSIFSYLQVNPVEVLAKMKKSNTFKNEEIITNYSEIQAIIKEFKENIDAINNSNTFI